MRKATTCIAVLFLCLLGPMITLSWRHSSLFAKAASELDEWGAPLSSDQYRDLPRQSASCNAALNIPRVALLFLTRNDVFHESMWADWFRGASGLIPITALQHLGDKAVDAAVRRHCTISATAPLLEQQFLFNVYTHPSPSFEGYPKSSIFHQHAVPNRLETTWTSYNMTDAVRIMIRHALRDPSAQYFAVLSDTGVPLYPPTVVYIQLMAETRSRINACADRVGTGRGPAQWEWQEPLNEVKGLNRGSWRKSMQSVGLKRPHAEIVVRDESVIRSFRRHCRSWSDAKGYHQCKVDEHYMATLLSLRGLDRETDCKGYLVTSNWELKGRHSGGPHEWEQQEVNTSLFRSVRQDLDWGQPCGTVGWDVCRVEEAIHLADTAFVNASKGMGTFRHDRLGGSHAVLTQDCPLFARKFPAETATLVYDTFRDAKNALRIIPYS